ncbi:hypothetical protein [Amycolatopsis sp. EV170708-02-1]|uniref:hypothetical protein n=1 Tax=Amycolatopsis sp. EV170708-02-1 TaxID=2919322 RepID=UPI001F0BA796|nr:hypothetical protein [Amycolatopsis sp. EV170708-02-1]UMP06638.1 hypothetical protein MJQ72_18280 [Amycolatopsis sp. EV170708-02-1]
MPELALKKATWREWLGLAAGLLALVALFLPWTTLTASRPEIEDVLKTLPATDVTRDAWRSGFLAWAPLFLLFLPSLAVVLFGRVDAVRRAGLPHLWLMAAIGALLLMALGWTTLDWQFDADQRGILSAAGIEIGTGLGRYLGLVAAAVSVVVAFFDVRVLRAETRTRRP